MSRAGSRNSLSSGRNTNRSNNNVLTPKRAPAVSKTAQVKEPGQKTSSSLKVLGQDGEISEDMLREDTFSDRQTPISSRTSSKLGSRPASTTSRRTITPSKHVTLQAMRRKEDSIESFEPIDFSQFDEPTTISRHSIPSPQGSSDSGSEFPSPRSTPISAAERLAMIEQRTREMTSALSSSTANDIEADLSHRLDLIDKEREEIEQRQKEEEAQMLQKSRASLTVEDGQFTYRNEHYQSLSSRDSKDKISGTFIFDGKPSKDVSDSGSKRVNKLEHDMFAVDPDNIDRTKLVEEDNKDSTEEKQDSESGKKDEAAAKSDDEDSSDDDDDTEEDDIIGEKGKAPNALLMEFLGCMMEEDYENAEKLCKMILIYEPENQEALSFAPLIQEKLKQEEEESDDDDSDDSDDDDDSDDSDDDDDDDDEDDSDESVSEDEGVAFRLDRNPDSGIASANSD